MPLSVASSLLRHRSYGLARCITARAAHTLPSKPSTKYLEVTHPEDNLSPETAQEIAELGRYILPVYARPPVLLVSGKGMNVLDSTGRQYLDFTGGIAVNALGHADPELADVMYKQANTLLHSGNIFLHAHAGALAAELVHQTQLAGGLGYATGMQPGPPSTDDPKVFFTNSGTEANEAALKIARMVGKTRWAASHGAGPVEEQFDKATKWRVLSFAGSFHGRSMGALSATHNRKYQAPFQPLVAGFDNGRLNSLEDVERLVGPDTCAVIVEPIQGEGGVHVADEAFLRALRSKCDEVGAVLIYDEIQCGLFRTGSMWAHSSMPPALHPDMITTAKPLANGYPVGAVLARGSVAGVMGVGSHGTTFGGSPMATALGLHVLRRLSQMTEHIQETGAHLQARLAQLAGWWPERVGHVRGRGLILGLPLLRAGDPAVLVEMARQRGVLLLTAGKDAVRLVPSLSVQRRDVELAVEVIEGCLGRMCM